MHYDQDQEHGSGHESCENGGDDGDRMYNDTPRVAKTKYYRKLPPPKRGAHLTRLFRPELLLQSRTPLSSDEFSHFARHASEEERRTNTADIEALWNKLTLEIIPEFARDRLHFSVQNTHVERARAMSMLHGSDAEHDR